MEKKKIVLVSLGHMSCDINSGALPAALPYIRAAYSLDFQATGALMFAYSCLSSIIQPLLGFLADRHNKPWFIPVGVAMAGCGLAVAGFLSNYWIIFLCIMFSGIGSAFFHPEGARFANRVSGDHKGAGMSIFSIGGNSGFILGPLLVTVFVGALGMHGMAVFAVLGLFTATALYLGIRNMTPQTPISARKAEQQAEMLAGDLAGAEAEEQLEAQAKANEPENNWREFGKLIFVIVPRTLVFVGCNTFIPLYWVNHFGQAPAAGAFALMLFGSCGVGFNIVGGVLSDKIGYITVIRIAFTLMPALVFIFSTVENVLLGYVMLPLLGMALYLPFSSQVVLGQKLLARNIGFASGVTLGLATTLGGVAQPVLGWLADSRGLTSVFVCLAVCGLVGTVFSYTLNRKYQKA